jgi:hypothetical protein
MKHFYPLETFNHKAERFEIYDVFSVDNETGQGVIDELCARESLVLYQPTAAAYEAGKSLVEAINAKSAGNLTDEQLSRFVQDFINAHSTLDSDAQEWTTGVPLFYATLKVNGKHADASTCTEIQSWILREFWLRKSPGAEVDIIRL